VNRGDIYLADLGEPRGHEQASKRPVLIVSAQPWLESTPPVVTVLPLTRTYRERSTHVEVEPGTSGLKATSYAKCEDIRAISPQRLDHYFGRADDMTLFKIDLILRRLLAL
jgi:mRNA interferase MazF